MVEIFRIGHYGIYLFGLTVALGILGGICIMLKEAERKELNKNLLMDLTIYTLVASLIGARLYYVAAFNLKYFLANPQAILFIRDGGLSIQGALIFGIIFALWYTKKKNISFWRTADTFAPGIIMGQAIGRIGCDIFGIPMAKAYPWGVMVNAQLLHPAQLYEVLLDLILFTYLWRHRSNVKYDGELFMKYIIGFSIIRALVEFFRINPVIFGPLSIAHVTSFVIIAIAVLINNIIKRRNIIDSEYALNDTVVVPMTQYILIGFVGVIGIWFYYFIH